MNYAEILYTLNLQEALELEEKFALLFSDTFLKR